MNDKRMGISYADAWRTVRDEIDARYPFPQHQGTTDITEVIDFQDHASYYGLTNRQYNALIDKAQNYHDKKDRETKDGN